MKTQILIFCMITALSGSHLRASQAGGDGSKSEIRPGIPVSEGELTSAVQLHVKRGDALRASLLFTEAQREYRQAVEIARREGHLPSRTMWLLANAYYNGGDVRGAATVLDQLANEAASVGDVAVQAIAIYNAAWLNGQAGQTTQAAARVAQVERLLRSPYMPGALRDYLSARLPTTSDVAVKH
jgi:hypothetical protein